VPGAFPLAINFHEGPFGLPY